MKVRFGMLMTDAVGKAGGQFIQRTRFGNVLRNITIPVQRLASLQNPQRATNGYIFSYWRNLSASERALWAIIGSNLRSKNAFGDVVAMSGREAFSSCSSLIYPFTSSLVSASSFSYLLPVSDFTNVVINTTTGTINFEPFYYESQEFFQLKGAILKNNSINLNLKKLKTFIRIDSISDNNTIYDYFNDNIGVVTAGDWVQLAIRAVSASGLASEWQMFKVQVV